MDIESKEYKMLQVEKLRAVDIDAMQLDSIDQRLKDYVLEVRDNYDLHNLYEILSVLKFTRMMGEYVFRPSKVKRFVKLYESLKFSGLDGRKCYKLTRIQYFQFACILGFYYWEEIGEAEGMPDTDSEKMQEARAVESVGRKRVRRAEARRQKIENGKVYELRRLVSDAVLFVPRKFSKTTSTAALAVNELLFGDNNAQAYTAGNSYKQANICFSEISKIVKQLDGRKRYFKALRETLSWKQPNRFGRESFIECLSGGADTKDGLAASLVIFDEYAQAKYIKDHSVGAELLQVLVSSMGTRRERLVVIITTASRVTDGPFSVELENVKKVLRDEYRNDRQFASLFMPDAWEMDGDAMGERKVWKKCNPHIGVTVQEGYYRDMWNKAQVDAEALVEFKTKLLNVFVSKGVKDWISGSFARSLQVDFSIEQVKGKPMAMVGLDLSVSDDFSVVVYNIYSAAQKKFYIWLDCYIPEETLSEHANKELYKVWIEAGWMKVCKGAIIDARMIVEDILKRSKKVNIMQVGYDAYKAQEVVNALAAAVKAMGSDPDKVLKAVPQTYGAFTSPVETFEMAAKGSPARVALCMNPILPYCFDNCYLDEDRMRNKKPIKRKANLKIDAAIGTLETFWLYNNFDQ